MSVVFTIDLRYEERIPSLAFRASNAYHLGTQGRRCLDSEVNPRILDLIFFKGAPAPRLPCRVRVGIPAETCVEQLAVA